MVFHALEQDAPLDSCVLHVHRIRAGGVSAFHRPRDPCGRQRSAPQRCPDPAADRSRAVAQDRMFATLASFFALLALALGAIGIYGIVAYRVARRTAEIGVRMALGAQKRDVIWLVLRETLVLLAAGAAIGIPAALAAARLIKSLLFGLQPSDPVAVVCATAALFGAGTLAGLLPARRAASVEPSLALRSD